MKVIASNDTFEFLKLGHEEARSQFTTHNLQMLDQRAEWTLRLLQSWGMAGTMGDILAKYGCGDYNDKIERVPPQELVMRICEVVDAAWSEMRHRGWIVNAGSLSE